MWGEVVTYGFVFMCISIDINLLAHLLAHFNDSEEHEVAQDVAKVDCFLKIIDILGFRRN